MFSNLSILSVPDEDCSKNAPCVLILISIVLLHVSFNSSCSFNRSIKYIQCLPKLLTTIITYGMNGHLYQLWFIIDGIQQCDIWKLSILYTDREENDIGGRLLGNPRDFYYLHYILMQKQYDISGRLLGNQRDLYYLHYMLIQKQYDISGRLLCIPRDFYYLHYILIQKQYDISGRFLCNPRDFYYRQDIKV